MDYNFQPSSRWSHRITPLSLNFTRLTRTTERFDQLILANPALGLSLSNQFIPKVGLRLHLYPPRGRQPTLHAALGRNQ